MQKSLRRSALYMPAANPRALAKARQLPCDMVLIDLEDSVAPEAKAPARDTAAAAIAEGGYGPREVVLRLNAPSTPYWADDVAVLGRGRPDGVLVPKIEAAADVDAVAADLAAVDPTGEIGLWLMIETPASVLNALAIAHSVRRVPQLQGFVVGTNDLVKDTGVVAGAGRALLQPWLMTVVAAAKAASLSLLDGVYNDLEDAAGFADECAQGRAMGMDGKSLIHPRQVVPCNAAFSPTEAEVADAQAIVAAFAAPDAAGKGVLRVNGRMVERLHHEMAVAVLARAAAIGTAETGAAETPG